jgi:hypothetical protein
MKLLDLLIILFSLCLTAVAALWAYASPEGTARVEIRAGGKTWVYPLGAEMTIPVEGPLGETIVAIHGAEASVASSPCANKFCVAAGSLRRNGEWTACLPNDVFVLVEGGGKAAGEKNERVDAASW